MKVGDMHAILFLALVAVAVIAGIYAGEKLQLIN